MKRKLKALGLALVAVFAMGALGASSASAEFTVEEVPPPILTGEEIEQSVFEVTGTAVQCEAAEYEAEVSEGNQSTITVAPILTECTGFGIVGAKVTGFAHNDPAESECHFVLDTDGTADLGCAEGGEVTIEAATCVVHIPPQEGLGEIEYATGTREGKHDLTLDINITSIEATHTDGFLCPMTGSGVGTEGTLKGEVTMWAEVLDSPLDLTHPDWES